MAINYNEEQQRLKNYKPEEGSLFWKPTPGQHKVKALSELEEADPYIEPGKDPKPQARIKLLVDGEEKIWTMSIGKSLASAYGQLVNLASEMKGTLLNLEFTIVVVFDGKSNSYTIVKG